jgi:hypothetical protein
MTRRAQPQPIILIERLTLTRLRRLTAQHWPLAWSV